MDTYYQVEAIQDGVRMVLADVPRPPPFYPASIVRRNLRFETEQEAFAAAGRYCTDYPFSPYNPLVFRYTVERKREQVKGAPR